MNRVEKTHLPVAALTHPGMKGKNNEDRFGVSSFRSPAMPNVPILLAVLSDGIGGNRAGEVASELAVNLISQYVAESDGRNPQVILEAAIHYASARIQHQAQQNPEQLGMGATCACAWVAGDRLFTATVGDSRIYLMRADQIQQLSTDHTWIQEALERGLIQPNEVNGHPNAHVIRRYLGSPTPPEVDFRIRMETRETDTQQPAGQGMRLLPNDFLLLCSDGLTDLVSNEEILAAFKEYSLEEAGQYLVDLANQRGGHDNITLIAVQMPEARTKPVPAAAPAGPVRMRTLLTGCLGVIALAVAAGVLAGGYLLYAGRGQPTPTNTPSLVTPVTATPTRTPLPIRRTQTTPTPGRISTATPTTQAVLPGGGPSVTPWPTNTVGLPIVSSTPR